MPYIEANSANFYYETFGEGQPLIFISGYTGSHLLWMEQITPLSKHFKVVIFDNRGAGQTKDDGRALSAELMADDVIAIANALGLEKPHVIGSSMGGTIAQQVAIRHPDKISKIGLMVTVAKWRQAMLKDLGATLKMREADVDFDIQYEAILALAFGEEFLNNNEKVEALKNAILNDPNAQTLENQQRQYKVLENFDARSDLDKITAPTLIMRGNEDVLALMQETDYLIKNIKNASGYTFSCAHGIPHEKPKELTQVILDFFK